MCTEIDSHKIDMKNLSDSQWPEMCTIYMNKNMQVDE